MERMMRGARMRGEVRNVKKQGDGALRVTVLVAPPVPPEASDDDRKRLLAKFAENRSRMSLRPGAQVDLSMVMP